MRTTFFRLGATLRFLLFATLTGPLISGGQDVSPLPAGVEAVWDFAKAFRETTPTRERICINGLWKWQPGDAQAQQPPATNWGFFKVPGCWPGITDYMQKDCQTVFAHPAWKSRKLSELSGAWYQREITIPETWSGRRISLRLENLNSFAVAFLDGTKVGEMQFPVGELEITSACRVGGRQTLSLFVVAMPRKGVMLSYTDSASAREVKGSVERRGLCGDAFLMSTPSGPRLRDVRVETSFRNKECAFDVGLESLASEADYRVRATVREKGGQTRQFDSRSFKSTDLKNARFAFTEKWIPAELWDVHTPQNLNELELSLLDGSGKVLDTDWKTRFGFREFWIDGRDFYLNGTRMFLSTIPLDNAQVSAWAATYETARESFERMKSFGINFVYTHNYGCQPGSHLAFTEILRAADDAGMLVAFSQPHFSHYEWTAKDADQSNGYARHAAYYVATAGNHPSVVAYSMSHNATGYNEDMNPAMIDGIQDARDNWALKNSALALRAEAIVKAADPGRIVYHHASGNLGSMHPINFYPNWVPVQEMSDWFEHWATKGVKPVFLCEYGAPFTWDWTMYRGWYKGEREFGSATVPWEFCVAEWNAQFFGDRAFRVSEPEKANLRWEAKQFKEGKVWHRWDYPFQVGSSRFEECYPVFSMYLTENWRAFRTWGVSAISPWEHAHFWKLREGVDNRRRELGVDWQKLQRPGFSPDYLDQQYQQMDLAYERTDWIATPAAQALFRNNRPLLGYIAGKPARFSSKDHNFFPGETVEKQIILINNSREPVNCECAWSLGWPQAEKGNAKAEIGVGQQERLPLKFLLPPATSPGRYELRVQLRFSTGEIQEDSFTIDVLPTLASLFPKGVLGDLTSSAPGADKKGSNIAVFDPKGETRSLLSNLGIPHIAVDAGADLSGVDLLVVGKGALELGTRAPDLARVREGLKVIVFEQTGEVLEKRLGFRVAEYGLRQVFARVPDHPVLAGLNGDNLRDWRGEATILPPALKYETRPRQGVTVQWCGIPVTRLWRCGNRGNVASVLIEKPAKGDFLPLLDGGYSLQYSPLMEFREGRGLILFCQVDVTGRTETDAASEILVRNLLRYAVNWTPSPIREVVYAGSDAGRNHLEKSGVHFKTDSAANLLPDQVLVLGLGGGKAMAGRKAQIGDWLQQGGHLLAVGIDQEDADAVLPFKMTLKRSEHIACFFEPFAMSSTLQGIGPADVHNRDPRELPLVSDGARAIGDGVLGSAEDGSVVFCQMAPWDFEKAGQMNLKRTHRRASFALNRLLANLGAAGSTPLLDRIQKSPQASEKRWLSGFYVDEPEEWDDPYRFFRW